MHASISCPKADPVLPPSTTGPKSRLVAGQKTSSLAQHPPAALRLRGKYYDFFQSAIHAISWNAQCVESRRQLDDFSISTICWELPIVQRSGDNSNRPAILFWLPPKKCHILSLLLPTQIFKRKWCHCHIVRLCHRSFCLKTKIHLWNSWINKTMETVEEKKGENV